MQLETDGLVIGEMAVGESDRLVTILTDKIGILKAFAKGAKSLKSGKNSSTQLLSYSHFNIYIGNGSNSISESKTKNVFFDLRKDLQSLSLAQYICELSLNLAPQGEEAGSFLKLVLNALYLLGKNDRPPLLIKTAVEMRMLGLAGFAPDLVACRECGKFQSDPMYLLPDSGSIVCGECIENTDERKCILSPAALSVLRHTIYAEDSKLFSFTASEETLKIANYSSETLLQTVVDKPLNTLQFYHSMFDN